LPGIPPYLSIQLNDKPLIAVAWVNLKSPFEPVCYWECNSHIWKLYYQWIKQWAP